MRLAVGVRSADPVFLTVIVHFQVVGHLFAAFAITQHGHIWRMVKLEEFHAYDFTVTEYAGQAQRSREPWLGSRSGTDSRANCAWAYFCAAAFLSHCAPTS